MKTMNKSFIRFIFIGLLSSLPNTTMADFVVVEEQTGLEGYGNAQSASFQYAVLGGRPVCPEEAALLESLLPEREDKRFYGRAALFSAIYSISQITNHSTTAALINGQVVKRHMTKTNPGLELAIGYNFTKDFRGELEYVVNRNFTYTSNPVLSNVATPRAITAVLQNNLLLANFYYDFGGERFRPYGMAGLGVSVNSVNTTLSPPPASPLGGQLAKRYGMFAWNVGLGFRVSFLQRWFVDVSYRYIQLGTKLQLEANSVFKLRSIYSMTPVSLGIMYLF